MAHRVTDRQVKRRMQRIITLVVSSSVVAGSLAEAQTSSRYRMLVTDNVTTAELARAVREGYRVSPGATVAPGFLVLEGTSERPEYLVSDTLLRDAAAGRIPPGYRILPRTVRAFAYRRNTHSQCAAILERSPGDTRHRDYRVEHTVQQRTLRTGILNSAAAGYRPVVIAAGGRGFCAVLERESPARRVTNRAIVEDRGKDPYVLIGTSKTKELETEYKDAVAHGYRLHSKVIGEQIYLMEQRDEQMPPADYVFLSNFRLDTLQREMNESAARGYRVHPYSVSYTLLGGDGPIQVHTVMEKRPPPPVEYRVVGRGPLQVMFEKELVATGEQGWELVTTLGSGIAIMQRPAPTPK